MRTRDTCLAILSKKEKTFRRAQLVPVFLAIAGVACQLASLARTPSLLERQPAGAAVQNAHEIPPGYILPIDLEHTLSVKHARAGDAIEARITQEVPLPDREKIPFRSVVRGSVVSVVMDDDEIGAELTLRFDQVSHHKQNLSVTTSLRAIASLFAVRQAQMPVGAWDEMFQRWAHTIQIGGDFRFGDGSAVRNRWKEKVGEGVLGGVLVYARANPALGCEAPAGADGHVQALWLFSSDACGVYGLRGVQLVRNGQSKPIGEITLHFKKASMKLSQGTAMLLYVMSPP
jgi:hypothetical protein